MHEIKHASRDDLIICVAWSSAGPDR